MAKLIEKNAAIRLRKAGNSIGSIAHKLQVSKSTVSLWCRDVVLSTTAIKKITQSSKQKNIIGLQRYSERMRTQRAADLKHYTQLGIERLGALNERDVFCIGLGLYWGEGYKYGNNEFGFTNSDPHMIRFYILWLREVFGINAQELILRVSINESHKNRVHEVEHFWSEVTGVTLKSFTKTSLIKVATKKAYQNQSTHMGTLRIKVRNGRTKRLQILGAIQHIRV